MIRLTSIGAVFSFLLMMNASAQKIPDAGSILKNQKQSESSPKLLPKLLPEYPDIFPELESESKAQTSEQEIQIKAFKLIGELTIFNKDDLLHLVEDAIGQSLDLVGIESIVNQITQHYHKAGYFLAKAYLPPQDVTEGVITIAIQEGLLDTENDGVSIDNNVRLKRTTVKGILRYYLMPGKPINKKVLERVVLLLNDLSGISATANLAPGEDVGSSRISFTLVEAPLFQSSISVDNFGNRYTDSERLSLSVLMNNLSGYGDQLTFSSNASNQDNRYFSLAYQSLVAPTGLKLGINYSRLNYLLGDELSALNAKGSANTTTINAMYPFYRARNKSLYFKGAYDIKNYEDKANGVLSNRKDIKVFSMGLIADRYDSFYGGGINQLQFLLKSGELDLSGVSTALLFDQLTNGPQRNGQYKKLSYSFSRLQKIAKKLTLYTSLNGQLSNKNLDSSERLQMGGESGVRAYPSGEAAADEGYKLTVEWRYTVKQGRAYGDISARFFYDRAQLNQFKSVGSQVLINSNSFSISGWGMGVTISKNSKYNIDLSWAKKIGRNPLRDPVSGLDADGKDDKSRYWLIGSLYF